MITFQDVLNNMNQLYPINIPKYLRRVEKFAWQNIQLRREVLGNLPGLTLRQAQKQ